MILSNEPISLIKIKYLIRGSAGFIWKVPRRSPPLRATHTNFRGARWISDLETRVWEIRFLGVCRFSVSETGVYRTKTSGCVLFKVCSIQKFRMLRYKFQFKKSWYLLRRYHTIIKFQDKQKIWEIWKMC